MADEIQTTNERIKESEKKVVTSVTPGGALAASFAYGSEAWQMLGELDQALTDLANVDLGTLTGGCKGPDPDKYKTENELCYENCIDGGGKPSDCNTKCAMEILAGCASYVGTFQKASNAEDPMQKAGLAVEGVLELVESIFGVPSVHDKIEQCAEEQFRKFLRAIPVQYYLLILLSKMAKGLKDPKMIMESKEVSTPCKTKVEKSLSKEYENFLPQIDLPLIPRIPYINIMDMSDLVAKIMAEYFCFVFCAATTPLIQKTAKVALSIGDAWADSWADDKNNTFNNLPPLIKVPINNYISDEAILDAREKKLLAAFAGLSNDAYILKVRNYFTKIQNNENIGQEEFVFLFLGKAGCNIISKLLDKEVFPETSAFALGTGPAIIRFFSFLGSYVNFIKLVEDSRAKICPPDPCDLKDDVAIIVAVNDLCALLDPSITLPPIPIDALMKGSGADKFIVDNSYDAYKTIPKVSTAYDEYISEYSSNAQAVLAAMDLSSDSNIKGAAAMLVIAPEKSSLAVFGTKKVKVKKCITIFGVTSCEDAIFAIDLNNIKEVFLSDSSLKLKPFENAINKYWIENSPGSLKFTKPSLVLQITALNSEKEAHLGSPLQGPFQSMIYNYLENSFPYALIDIKTTPPRSYTKAHTDRFSFFQTGWHADDAESVAPQNFEASAAGNLVFGLPFEASIYNRYTKPIIETILDRAKSSNNSGKIEDINKDLEDFIKIKGQLL